jgi:PAS domain S-box-containing protein
VTLGGRWRIGLLSGLLLVGAAALAVALPRPHLDGTTGVLLVGLALLVAAAEFLQVRYRVGTQVDGSNLVEAVLAPLVVIAPNAAGILAVAAGQLLAGVLRRNQPLKLGFNVVQWSFAFAVGAQVWLATPGQDPATWAGVGTLVLAVLTVGLVNLASFSAVMLLIGSDLRDLRPMVGIGWATGLLVNTALGLLFTLDHEATPWSLLLVPVPLVVLHLAYRGVAAARADRTRLAGMHRAASLLAEPLDPRPAIPDFLRATAEVFDTRRATLVLKVEGGREVHRVDLDEGGTERVHVESDDTASLEGALAAQLGAVRITAADASPLGAALRQAGHQDCLAAPMLEGGRALGALLLLDQDGLEGAAGGQLSVLEALAREVAAALTKGRLLDSVLEERRKLSTVIGTTSDGIASFDDDGTVRSWNPAMTQITGLEEPAVLGRADVLTRLDPRTPHGDPVDLTEHPLPPEVSVRRKGGGRRRLACSWSRADDLDGRLLVLVARDVTPVQEFEALRAEFGRLVEQEAARRLVVEQLQAAVVPATPVVEGLELAVNYVASDPKEPTGGDLWDWHLLPSGELHLVVVDVLGHGVAATKSALAVVHTLRSLALDETPLEDIVGRAAYLLERQDTELVATVVLGRLDPRTGRLRIVSGGHPPALVASADGTVRDVTATGGAIGWPGAGSDGVEELVLRRGDTLLLYTDGLVEARKDIVEGLESLVRDLASVATLPVATMTDELVRRALAGADRRDDTLALVVRLGDVPVTTTSFPVPANHWEIAPELHAVPQLRRDAVRWLADQGLAVGDLALVVAELLANAVRAARSRVTLDLALTSGGLEVVVSDDGVGIDALPDDGDPGIEAESSRGLFLVRRLATDLELLPGASGTTIRCRVPLEQLPGVPGQPRRDVAEPIS